MSRVGRTAPVLETLMIDPPPGLHHPLADQRGEPERPLEVDGDHLVEELLGDVAEALVDRRDAGVVDEHVDAAEVAIDVLDQPVELLPVPDVAGVGARAAAVGAQRGGDLVAGVGLAADDDDLGAGLREAARDREPEPAGSAGDDGDAVGKVEAVPDQGLGWLAQCVHLLVGVRWGAGEREGRDAVRAAVFGHLLVDASGVQQQVEVSEHLPDDQQRLFEDRLLGPQVGGDPVRGGRAGARARRRSGRSGARGRPAAGRRARRDR